MLRMLSSLPELEICIQRSDMRWKVSDEEEAGEEELRYREVR